MNRRAGASHIRMDTGGRHFIKGCPALLVTPERFLHTLGSGFPAQQCFRRELLCTRKRNRRRTDLLRIIGFTRRSTAYEPAARNTLDHFSGRAVKRPLRNANGIRIGYTAHNRARRTANAFSADHFSRETIDACFVFTAKTSRLHIAFHKCFTPDPQSCIGIWCIAPGIGHKPVIPVIAGDISVRIDSVNSIFIFCGMGPARKSFRCFVPNDIVMMAAVARFGIITGAKNRIVITIFTIQRCRTGRNACTAHIKRTRLILAV